MANSTQQSSLKVYLRLLKYVVPYWGLFAISIFGFLIFASTQPMLAGILKYFVDGLSNPEAVLFPTVPYLRDLQLLQAVPLLIILIAAWQGLGSFLGNYFLAKVSLGLVHDLRVQLFNNLLVLPNRYFDTHNSGHLISRITFNVTMVTGAATDAIKVVIREGMTVVFQTGQLAGMVDSLKQCQTPQEVYDRYLQITGYCKCCVDCNFIDQKGADELMCLAAYLAGNEQARAEAQQKAGKKA